MPNLVQKISKSNLALVCIILLLGFATHAGMLDAPFKTLDDATSIINNPYIKDFSHLGEIFRSSFFGGKHYYRPMVSVSFMVDYHFFGLHSFYYNLTNLGLHLAVAATVFFLIFVLLEDRAVAFFTSLLFAVHPINWEAVANIPGRAVILGTFFTVSAFFFFCLSEEKKKFAACYTLSLILFACGLLSKESTAMLPVLLLSYMFFSERGDKRYALTVPFFLIIAAYITLRRLLGIMETYPWRTLGEHALGFITFLRACLTYLGILVWPAGLHFDRAQQMFLKFSEPGLSETLIAFAVLGAGLIKARKQMPGYVIFFITWFCIELFPVSQVITTIGVGPGYISTAEHFLYMPAIGIFVLLVLGAKKLYAINQKARALPANILRIFIVCIFLSLMAVTVNQEIYARTALSMFKRTLEYNPNNARILYSAGLELAGRKQYGEAEHYFLRALEREPIRADYRIALGRSLFDQGKVIEGIGLYDSVGDAGQWEQLLKDNKAEAYQAAISRYQTIILREPDNALAYYSLGTIFSRMQRIDEAVEQYKRAAALKPDYKNALFNLASSYGMIGMTGQAIEYYGRVIAIPGDEFLDYFAYQHLGEIYQRAGDAAEAEKYLRKAEAVKSKK